MTGRYYIATSRGGVEGRAVPAESGGGAGNTPSRGGSKGGFGSAQDRLIPAMGLTLAK